MTEESSQTQQILLSLVVAAVIVLATIAIVTMNLGRGLDPEEMETRQERLEELDEMREERREEGQKEG